MSARIARTKKNQVAALALRDTMRDTLAARIAALQGEEKNVAVELPRIIKNIDNPGFVNALAALTGFVDFAPLVAMMGHHDKLKVSATQYVQAKTLEKVVNIVHALAGGTADKMSAYTLQVLRAALDNGGEVSMQCGQASLSRRVAKPDSEALTSRANYSVGTASAQNSQVREVVRVLALGETVKGKRGDVMKLSEGAREKLAALFAEEGAEGEGEE